MESFRNTVYIQRCINEIMFEQLGWVLLKFPFSTIPCAGSPSYGISDRKTLKIQLELYSTALEKKKLGAAALSTFHSFLPPFSFP